MIKVVLLTVGTAILMGIGFKIGIDIYDGAKRATARALSNIKLENKERKDNVINIIEEAA